MKKWRYFLAEQNDGRLTLTINNPPVNALDAALMTELSFILAEIQENSAVKEVTITGQGKYFSVGANIEELVEIMESPNPYESAVDFSSLGHRVLYQIYTFPKPITALINGFCLGGGMELALACHDRIAVKNAVLGLPEVTLGIFPGWGGIWWLRKLVGDFETKRIAGEGLYLTAQEAQSLKIVKEVLPGDFDAKKPKAKPVSVAGQNTVRFLIRTHPFTTSTLGQYFRDEETLFGLLFSNSAREGVKAFLEKRKPKFEYAH